MIHVLTFVAAVRAHGQHVPHNRYHTRGATIVGEFVDGEIVGPTSVPGGWQPPTRWQPSRPASSLSAFFPTIDGLAAWHSRCSTASPHANATPSRSSTTSPVMSATTNIATQSLHDKND